MPDESQFVAPKQPPQLVRQPNLISDKGFGFFRDDRGQE
jgi:hypothetical protein